MKLSALATLLPLFLSSSAVFAATIPAHAKRDTTDVCAPIDSDVQITPNGQNVDAGHLDLCLCLSDVPDFLTSNSVAKSVVGQLGSTDAQDYFTKLIQDQQGKQQCQYPPNAVPSCSVQSPCAFTCEDGYTPSPSTNPTQCNAASGSQGASNPSSGSQNPSNPSSGSQGASKPNRRDQPQCPTDCNGIPNALDVVCNQGVCNVLSCKAGYAVSPAHDSCVQARPNRRDQPMCPADCNDIPNALDVVCNQGACNVLSCKAGYAVSPAHDSCVQTRPNRRDQPMCPTDRNCNDIPNVLDVVCNQGTCDVLSCKAGYTVSPTHDSCVQTGATPQAQPQTQPQTQPQAAPRDAPAPTVDDVLGMCLKQQLIVGFTDLAPLKQALGPQIEALDIDSLLQLLITKGLIPKPVPTVLALRQKLGC
jgi:hypothetical protein